MNCVISKWQGLLICPGELILACFENNTSSFSCPGPTTKKVKNCIHRALLVQEAFFLFWKKFYCHIGIPFLVAIFTLFADSQQKTRPGADWGSDHELLIAKFRLKWKKVGKTTRPFRYDLNQIPYEYTVEVTNRFKGLYMINRVPEELWMEVCDIAQEAQIKITPEKKKCKKAIKRQNDCLKRTYK